MSQTKHGTPKIDRLAGVTIPICIMHDAGHIAGRFMTSQTMALSPVEAITSFNIHHDSGAITEAENRLFIAGGNSMRPYSQTPRTREALEYHRAHIKPALDVGIDIDTWAAAKVFQEVAGPAAEARAGQMRFWKAAEGPACGRDLREAGYAAYVAGWSEDQLYCSIENSVASLNRLWSVPKFWRALLSTFEGLCKLYAGGQPSLGLFAAEGGQFIGGHGMSQDSKLRTAAGLSDLWDGGIIRRVRALDGTVVLPGRRFCMALYRFLDDSPLAGLRQ